MVYFNSNVFLSLASQSLTSFGLIVKQVFTTSIAWKRQRWYSNDIPRLFSHCYITLEHKSMNSSDENLVSKNFAYFQNVNNYTQSTDGQPAAVHEMTAFLIAKCGPLPPAKFSLKVLIPPRAGCE